MHNPVMQNRAKSEKKTITVAVYGNIVWKFIPLSIQNRLFAHFNLDLVSKCRVPWTSIQLFVKNNFQMDE